MDQRQGHPKETSTTFWPLRNPLTFSEIATGHVIMKLQSILYLLLVEDGTNKTHDDATPKYANVEYRDAVGIEGLSQDSTTRLCIKQTYA